MLSRLTMVAVLLGLLALIFMMQPTIGVNGVTTDNKIYFVSDRDEPGNSDIYSLDASGTVTRLTTDPAIDNHPEFSANGTLVYSSNRFNGGENPELDFELFIADPDNVESTTVELTANDYPDRHPHFSPDGTKIIYDAKFLSLLTNEPITDQCSIPVNADPGPDFTYRHEGVRVIRTISGGPFTKPPLPPTPPIDTEIISLDLTSANPILWPPNTRTYAGHPSFSPSGDKIVFSGSVDGQGNNWEMYTADYNNASDTVSNINQVTSGPTVGDNPIKMSGGGHFSNDGTKIIFTSTRNSDGMSHIYTVGADVQKAAVGSPQITQITSRHGNDYVPHQREDGSLIFVSDRPGDGNGDSPDCPPSTDLDIFGLNALTPEDLNNPVINMTDNDFSDEVLLIGDEVSWFCGVPRNLSECIYYPKAIKLKELKNMFDWQNLPLNFPFRDLYPYYTNILTSLSQQKTPKGAALLNILTKMNDPVLFEEHKDHYVVVPTVLNTLGNSAPSKPTNPSPGNNFLVSSFFDVFMEWSPSGDNDIYQNERFTYDLYLDTNPDPQKIVAANLDQPNFLLNTSIITGLNDVSAALAPGQYYWKVVAKDSMGGQSDGDVWSFNVGIKDTFIPEQSWDSGNGNWEADASKIVVGDYNGDNMSDVAVLYGYAHERRVRLWVFQSDGSGGFLAPQIWWDSGPNNWDWHGTKLLSGDFDGDTLDDIVAFYGYSHDRSARAWVFLSNGSTFDPPQSWWNSGPGNWDWAGSMLTGGDFNGDNLGDLAVFYGYAHDRSARAWVFLSNGSTFDPPQSWWNSGPGNWDWAGSMLTGGDFNGDNLGDLTVFYGYGPERDARAFTFLSQIGNFDNPQEWWHAGAGNWDWAGSMLTGGDYTGDGNHDLAVLYNYTTHPALFVFPAGANGFAPPNIWYSWNPGNWDWSATKLVSGDFNGDGTADPAAFYNYGGGRSGLFIFK